MSCKISKESRKFKRDELKRLEKILHPCPKVGDIEILHRHTGQYIVFSAWRGKDCINHREVKVFRGDVLLGLIDPPGISPEEIRFLTDLNDPARKG